MATTRIRVLVAAETRLYREGLAQALDREPQIHVVAIAPDHPRTLSAAAEHGPDAVLVDLGMGDALATVGELHSRRPATTIVVLGLSEQGDELVSCAEAGISGYVTRDASLSELVDTIERAHRGELPCSALVAGTLLRRVAALAAERPTAARPGAALTSREAEILALIDDGLSNKEIARRLTIQLATVKNHVHNILEKLGVSRRGEAAAYARHQVPGRVRRI